MIHFSLFLWKKKTDAVKISAKPRALKSLLPTDKALDLKSYCHHHQGVLPNQCLHECIPDVDLRKIYIKKIQISMGLS